MPMTPLYTIEELNLEIDQAKKDLRSARSAVFRQIDSGGNSRRVQQDRVVELQNHLQWLQQQRATLQIGAGPQALVGRPAR